MSESTAPQADPNANAQKVREPSKPTRRRTPKSGASNAASIRAKAAKGGVSVTDLARARLRARGVKSDERLSDECKVVRGILRSNFAAVRKNDASVRKAKDAANDRRPWPTTMNAKTFDVVIKPRTK